MNALQGSPPWVSPTECSPLLSSLAAVDSKEIGHLETLGSATLSTICSRLRRAAPRRAKAETQYLGAECLSNRLFGHCGVSSPVEAIGPRRSGPFTAPARVLTTSSERGGSFRPLAPTEVKTVRFQAKMCVEICSELVRAASDRYAVMTRPQQEPSISRPLVCAWHKAS